MMDTARELELAHIVLARNTPADVPLLRHLRNGLVLLPSERPIREWDADDSAPPLPIRRAG